MALRAALEVYVQDTMMSQSNLKSDGTPSLSSTSGRNILESQSNLKSDGTPRQDILINFFETKSQSNLKSDGTPSNSSRVSGRPLGVAVQP